MAQDAEEATDLTTAAFGRGDEHGLRVAYEQHGALVYSYCRRSLGDPDAAKDATQETFVAAWRNRDRFDVRRGSLPAWLLGIARYKVLDQQRAGARRPLPVDPPDGGSHEAPRSGGSSLDRLADRLLLADALASLPDRSRSVIEAAFFEDLTHQQIAEKLDLPLGTVKSDVRRGLQRLRAHLELDAGRPEGGGHG